MTMVAAYKIVRALSVFDNEPEEIKRQAEQIIMQRVELMRNGDRAMIEGAGLITEYVPPPEPTVDEPKDDAGSSTEPPTA